MLVIDKAQKTFLQGMPNQRVALDSLSLTLAQGEFATMIGSNGAGKSTLFNAITGAFLLDSGRITVNGVDITWRPPHKRAFQIGYLFQDPMKGTAPHMTIVENLSLAYSRGRRSPLRPGVTKKDAAFFRTQLARFGMGLEDRLDAKVGLLSGGQRQALSLLMSTVAGPGLLLLDEHTAALDPVAAEKIMVLTKEIVQEQNLAAIMITHNIRQALAVGSRTIMLEDGRIALDISGEARKDMTPAALMQHYTPGTASKV
ncbi:MAG: ATP-binding cassette domain-containing protein [Christensenellaceae bacterium]|jgi:putative ABC transport system ATP-binding protein|nr:ATP-binding cassette domain-containing protein [Christensenellaceae bacterium]